MPSAICHLLGRAHQRKAAVPGGHALADQGQQVVRKTLRMGELQVHQVVDRRPVGMVELALQFGPGFGFGRTAHHMREGQHVHRPAHGLPLNLEVRDLALGPL